MSCFGLITKGARFHSTQGQIYCNGLKLALKIKKKGVEVRTGVFYPENSVRTSLVGETKCLVSEAIGLFSDMAPLTARGRIDV